MSAQPSTAAELVRDLRRGARIKYLFFWGHKPERDGSIGRGCLSQWWPASFVVDGVKFATAEHYMMWRKAMLFGESEVAREILAASHPRQAKMLGRSIRGFDQRVWDDERFGIVVDGSVAKFGQHDELRRFLLTTGNRVLVEASPADAVWGIGLTADHPHATVPERWRGLNLLGFALVRARDLLRPAT